MPIEAKLLLFVAVMLLMFTPQWERIMSRLFPYQVQISFDPIHGFRARLIRKDDAR